MEEIHALPGEPLFLGRMGENLARQIVFDVSEWAELYGAGNVVLIHQRQSDLNPYPVTIERVDNLVYWPVKSYDTEEICHYGKAELRYFIGPVGENQVVVKSATWQTVVLPALGPPTADTPDPVLDWYSEFLELAEQVRDNAGAVTELAEHVDETAAAVDAAKDTAVQQATAAQLSATSAATSAANAATSETNAANSATAAANSATAAQTSAANAANSQTAAANSATAAAISVTAAQNWAQSAQQAVDSLEDETAIYNPYVVLTATGNPVSFDDGADNIPVESLTVTLPVTQSGTGTPSPDNIRNFEGVDTFTVTRTDGNGGSTQSVTVSLASAGTVYGGSLNVSTGVLTVTHFQITFTGRESWGASGSGDSTIYRADFTSPAALNTALASQWFSCFPAASVTTTNTTKGARFASNTRAFFRPDFNTFPTYTDFKNRVADMYTAGTPLQGVAAFADPVTYPLTPQEVRTLLGGNVITSTAGTVTVNYRADPTILYNKLCAAVLSLGGNV